MKLKLLFCKGMQAVVDYYKEGRTVTEIETLISTLDMPSVMQSMTEKALKLVAYNVLQHNETTLANTEELLQMVVDKEEDISGLKALLVAIELTGVQYHEIISLVESKDFLKHSEKPEFPNISEPEARIAQQINKCTSLDALMSLGKSETKCVHERLQSLPSDVIDVKVI